ncbi:class I SAM-dependent methyltransferase [Nocardioides sp. SYSU D00038]|uniref:class I SAM-dependent methyltransferase n=1 Tax=Nocardioides sp. SYSU D00038 TaxID=2812554 RepID=UPI0027DDAAAF|nr:class I SAM-dependent methyltransferase [Nocardioides sp. SYSU D00038]
MPTLWERIARDTNGADYGRAYAERFRRIAERGGDVHGEAALVHALAPEASVLDAGCGTGRVAARLAELGHEVMGVDVDPVMLAEAERDHPDLDWRQDDLSTFDLGRAFDVVLVAGNTLPLLEPGTLGPACTALAAHVAPGGRLVTGFGLDAEHLPAGCPVLPLAQVDAALAAAGLEVVERWSSWQRTPFADQRDGYAVTVAETRTGGSGGVRG